MFVVPELSKRTTRVTSAVQFVSPGLFFTSSGSLHFATSPPNSRETSLAVNSRLVGGFVPPQLASVRWTASAAEEPPTGNDMSGAVVSSLPASLSGQLAGEFGWKGGRNLPSASPPEVHDFFSPVSVSVPAAASSSLSCVLL